MKLQTEARRPDGSTGGHAEAQAGMQKHAGGHAEAQAACKRTGGHAEAQVGTQ